MPIIAAGGGQVPWNDQRSPMNNISITIDRGRASQPEYSHPNSNSIADPDDDDDDEDDEDYVEEEDSRSVASVPRSVASVASVSRSVPPPVAFALDFEAEDLEKIH